MPWRDPDVGKAGIVHLGGSFAEVVANQQEIHSGRMPERPFVLVGQQYLADPRRANGSVVPIYSYAHVPHGHQGDVTAALTAQIERFAPGFRDRVLATAVTSPAELAAGNANFTGGDILTGATSARRLLLGPGRPFDPYRTGVPGVYLCSAATPPGPGAHGMCGANAAAIALRDHERGRLSAG